MQTSRAHTRSELTFRLDEIVIDALDPRSLARFWAGLLGYVDSDTDEEIYAIEDPERIRPSICFQRVSEAKLAKNRLHFDLDVGEGMFDTAVAKVLGLGGRLVDVGQPPTSSWAVMADPEGNEFCVIG